MMNYYDVLGVSKTASDAEIKEAYRNLIKAFHPDYYHGNKDFAEKKSKEINEAYSVLKNPQSRKNYDEMLEQEDSSDQQRQNAEAEADWARQSARAAEQKAAEEHRRFEEEQKKRMEAEEESRKSRAEADKIKDELENNSFSSDDRYYYEYNSHKSEGNNIKKALFIICLIVLIIFGLVIAFQIHSKNEREMHIKNNEIQTPGSATDFVGKNYQDVMTEFISAGFDNVEVVPLNDLVTGWVTKNGSVDSVSIAGNTEFSDNEYVKKDALVRIKYHSFSGKSSESSKDIKTKSKVPESAKTYKKWKYNKVVSSLENAGFTNIKVTSAEDLKTGWINKEGKIKSVLIDGEDKFKADDLFPKDANIEVIYHSFKQKNKSDTTSKNKFEEMRTYFTDKLKNK